MTARTTLVVGVLAVAAGAAWWCARATDEAAGSAWTPPVARAAREDDGRRMRIGGPAGFAGVDAWADERTQRAARDDLAPTSGRVEPLLPGDPASAAPSQPHDGSPRLQAQRLVAVRESEPVSAQRDWREEFFPVRSELPEVAAGLARQPHASLVVQGLFRLGGRPQEAAPGEPPRTRYSEQPQLVIPLLEDALGAARGVARQSLVLHLALALPLSEARERLGALLDEHDPDDAEDLLCVLAFLGEPRALVEFEQLARQPAPMDVRQPWRQRDIERLERSGARAVLRSYRCLEALHRAPYFHMDALTYGELGARFPWAAPGRTAPDARVRLLEAWLRRYPGHCGGDNACLELARLHLSAGRQVDALHAASRGALLPDGDARDRCLQLLIALAESADLRSDVLARRIDPQAPRSNASLLHYIWVRRLADELGVRAGLDELERIAQAEPELDLSEAWRKRWGARVPEALDSGLVPVALDDPLRRMLPSSVRFTHWSRRRVDSWGWGYDDPLLEGDHEAVALDLYRLRTQFRAWETLAEFERRAEGAPAEERIDWLYKQAALHYHESDVFYPIYAHHGARLSGRTEGLSALDGVPRAAPPVNRFAPEFSLGRALVGFRRVLSEGPGHPLADEALFSMGMAHIKLASKNTLRHRWRDARPAHLSAGVRAFERLALEFPLSPLADDGARAAAHWRGLGYGDT